MEKSSPTRHLAQLDHNGAYKNRFNACVIFSVVASVCLVLEYLTFTSSTTAQTIPKFFHKIGLAPKHFPTATVNVTTQGKLKESVMPDGFVTSHIDVNSKQNGMTTVTPAISDLNNFRKSHFMTVSGNGRLGNQMFEVAALIGTACRHNYTPYITKRHRLNHVFDINFAQDIHMYNVGSIGENKACAYNAQLENLSHEKNWTLNGYFQSWKYFNHCRHEVLKSFKFKQSIKRSATEILKTIYTKDRPLVGVHVRRTDMASSREKSRGYNPATPEYMIKALSYFRENLKNPLFIVVSDDRRWCAAHVKGPDVVYAGTGRAEVDIALLSLCNHTIITSGSFGWWGAYLNGGKTVYFSNFPGRGSWLEKQFEVGDYYLPDWIGME